MHVQENCISHASLIALLSSNRMLETITFGNKEAVTMKDDMAKADFSGKSLGTAGAMIVAAFLPKCQ